jgi:hypothetical protein
MITRFTPHLDLEVYLGLFAVFMVVGMEATGLSSKPKPSPPRLPPPTMHDKHSGDTETLEGKEWVT